MKSMIFNNGSHYQAVYIDICGKECTNRKRGHEPTEVPLFAQIYCTTDNKKKILMFSYTWIMM